METSRADHQSRDLIVLDRILVLLRTLTLLADERHHLSHHPHLSNSRCPLLDSQRMVEPSYSMVRNLIYSDR